MKLGEITNTDTEKNRPSKAILCRFCFVFLEEKKGPVSRRTVHVDLGTNLEHNCKNRISKSPFPTAYDLLNEGEELLGV
jgi:hypothetical protein